MKVLFVVTRFPVERPTQGDALRARNLMAELAAGHEITCAAVVHRAPEPAEVRSLEALGVRVEVIVISRAPAVARALRWWDRRPGQVRIFADRKAIDRVARLARDADIVHAQLVRAGPLIPADQAVTVDLIDALSHNFAGRARGRGPGGWPVRHEAARLARYEQLVLVNAAAGFVVTSRDREALGNPPGVEVVPLGVRIPDIGHIPRHPGRIIFSGNLGYAPNVDAAEWLATEIFPAVTADNAHLRIVGARPGRKVRRLSRLDRVTVVSDVADMPAELAAASVAVAPMRLGSGMQIKLLEAIAVGTPVVATGQAANALGLDAGSGVTVADEAGDIAAAIGALLAAPGDAEIMARLALDVIAERFAWPSVAAQIAATWERVAGQ